MLCRNAIIFVPLVASCCNAFWWGSEREVDPQPQTLKQVPVGYFRTFTYQPLAINPQLSNPYLAYQTGSKMYQTNPMMVNWQSPKPFGPQLSIYGPPPTQHTMMQTATQLNPATSASSPTSQTAQVPPATGTNAAPASLTQQTTQQQSANSASVGTSLNASPIVATYAANINTQQSSGPITSDILPPTMQPAPQFTQNLPHVMPLRSQLYQNNYVPDSVNLQYYTNVSPLPVQQIQFVPCMCPVTVSVTPEVLAANKRSDEVNVPTTAGEYRESNNVEPPSIEEN